jgi:plastocyanin
MRRFAGAALALGALILLSFDAAAEESSATIQDDYFLPVPIIVDIGDTVTWTNNGDHPHSVTADGDFDSTDTGTACAAIIGGDGCLAKGDQFTVTFNRADTFNYHCRVHGSAMVGSVVVRSAATTTTSTTMAPTTTATTAATSTSVASDQPTITQASLPSLPSTSRVALPKSIIRSKHEDDMRPWALTAVAIAGGTTIAGIVLVRRGRVPFG